MFHTLGLLVLLIAAQSCDQSKINGQTKQNKRSDSRSEEPNSQSDAAPKDVKDIPATIEIKPMKLKSLEVRIASPRLPLGLTTSILAIGHFDEGFEKDLTGEVEWKVSNSDAVQLIPGERTTARAASVGTISIVATKDDLSAEAALEVTAAAIVSVRLDPTNALAPVGGEGVNFKLLATLSDELEIDITSSAEWKARNALAAPDAEVEPYEEVADINNFNKKGFARGKIFGGVSRITAMIQGKEVSTELAVQVPRTLKVVTFESDFKLLPRYKACTLPSISRGEGPQFPHFVGASTQVSVYAYYDDCSLEWIDGADEIAFQSSNNLVAQFAAAPDPSDRLNFLSPGTANISATYRGVATTSSKVYEVLPVFIVALLAEGESWRDLVGYDYCQTLGDHGRLPPEPQLDNNIQFNVYGFRNDCTVTVDPLTADPSVTWSSSDSTIAVFSDPAKPGLLEVKVSGNVTVTASFAISATSLLTKVFPEIAVTRINVNPKPITR